MRLVDYHMHSKYSPDGCNEIHDLVAAAVLRGVEEICITDHYECTSNWTLGYNPEGIFADIEKVRYIYEGSINIRAGIELGNPWARADECNELLAKYPYDFVLGAVHTLRRDLSSYDYAHENVDKIMKEYIENLHMLIDFGNFDCVAHLDLPRRYAKIRGVDIDVFRDYKLEIKEVLTHLRDAGKGIEVNVSGLRTNLQKTMPEREIVDVWHDMGGEIITVGSDAHNKDDVGVFVENGIDSAIEAGFTHITTFERREAKQCALEFYQYD